MKALLFDLDRTLVDLQTYTDYGAALTEVQALVEVGEDADTPATDWDTPTRRCMSILVALSGTDRWQEVSDLIAVHELRAIPQSHPMPRLEEAMAISDHLPRAVVTLLAEEPARAALRHHGVSIPVVVPRRADLRPKPAPDQVLEACRLLEIGTSETVMIGDSSWDAEAAAHAGCRFVGVAATKAGIDRFGKEIATASNLVEAIRMASRDEG
ncbi:MAG: HAD hydrolase-like protein [bacterium]|nr:HAD hydrolase-like protein [bacterium]MYD03410.1 HAD family hydrolase [Acidimicrobiia bacterium]